MNAQLDLVKLSSLVESVPHSDKMLYQRVFEVMRKTKRASIAHFQRQLGVGYEKAVSVMNWLEHQGITGPRNEFGRSEIIIDLDNL